MFTVASSIRRKIEVVVSKTGHFYCYPCLQSKTDLPSPQSVLLVLSGLGIITLGATKVDGGGEIGLLQGGRVPSHFKLLFHIDKSSRGVTRIDEATPWDACQYA